MGNGVDTRTRAGGRGHWRSGTPFREKYFIRALKSAKLLGSELKMGRRFHAE